MWNQAITCSRINFILCAKSADIAQILNSVIVFQIVNFILECYKFRVFH